MHRLVALIIMLVVPLQFAWAAAVSVHGHVGHDVPLAGHHTHDHGHPGDADHDHDAPADSANHDQEQGDEGHHGHVHPVFSSLLAHGGLPWAEAAPEAPIRQPSTRFFSRTPPLLDRPPLASA